MKRKNITNIFLVLVAAILFLLSYYLNNAELSQILSIVGVVILFWAIMRIFKIKRFATED